MNGARLHYLQHLARLGAADLHPGGAAASERLLKALDVRSGQRVLEIGCGTGRTLIRVGSAHRVALHGLDPLREMLAAARLRLKLAGLSARAALVRADGASGLPYAAESFDRVYAESVLGFQAPEAARLMLAEVRRILRPGGRFVANEAVWRSGTGADTVSTIYESSLRDFGLAQSSEGGWTVEDWLRCIEEARFQVRACEPLGGSASPPGTTRVSHDASSPGNTRAPRAAEAHAAAARAGAAHAATSAVSYRARFGSAVATLLIRAGALSSPKLLRQQQEYRRRLARHAGDGRHVEAYLFVLERPSDPGFL
jgi:SAM-dependent methyltransferase